MSEFTVIALVAISWAGVVTTQALSVLQTWIERH